MTATEELNRQLPEQFQFSQSNLQDYGDCARRFLLCHVTRLRWPAIVAEPMDEYEMQLQRGDAFHRMIQQYCAGVSAERITQSVQDEKLATWWPLFVDNALDGLPESRYVETTLYSYVLGYRLVAKYDMLAVDQGKRVIILDWKTGRTRPKRDALARRLQTVVYPYVLAESGAVLNDGTPFTPEQIEMVYWFAEHPDKPERFQYDSDQHTRNKETLESLIRTIRTDTVFALTPDVDNCRYCEYRSFCGRGVSAGDIRGLDENGLGISEMDTISDGGFDFDFDQIAETEF
jgi:predicted RecB family nuclease